MNVAIVSGSRSATPMGLELAEQRLIDALRTAEAAIKIDLRVVGGRAARAHARSARGRWIPARPAHPRATAWRHADLIHLIGLDLPPPRDAPFVATVHDVSCLCYDDEGSLPPWITDITQRAALLLTPSAFTAAELHEHLGVARERIRVFGGGPALDARAAIPLELKELHALGIEPPVVLRYGGYTARKNVPFLLDAWARVPVGTLVLAGPPQPARATILARARSLERVVVLNYVPSDVLARLLRTAAVLVSPSLYEGFGLPQLEAMTAETPVVAVATPFAEEVCGGAAILVAHEPSALASAVTRVLTDRGESQRLRAAGRARAVRFTWGRAAAAVLHAYEEAATGTNAAGSHE